MMAHAVQLMANAVHPSKAPDVHDAIHLLPNAVHQVRLLIYMIRYAVYLIVNDVHPSGAPDVLYMIASTATLDGKCTTLKWGS